MYSAGTTFDVDRKLSDGRIWSQKCTVDEYLTGIWLCAAVLAAFREEKGRTEIGESVCRKKEDFIQDGKIWERYLFIYADINASLKCYGEEETKKSTPTTTANTCRGCVHRYVINSTKLSAATASRCYYHAHFTHKETEEQRNWETYLKPYSNSSQGRFWTKVIWYQSLDS